MNQMRCQKWSFLVYFPFNLRKLGNLHTNYTVVDYYPSDNSNNLCVFVLSFAFNLMLKFVFNRYY
jgi:hypothetical protein